MYLSQNIALGCTSVPLIFHPIFHVFTSTFPFLRVHDEPCDSACSSCSLTIQTFSIPIISFGQKKRYGKNKINTYRAKVKLYTFTQIQGGQVKGNNIASVSSNVTLVKSARKLPISISDRWNIPRSGKPRWNLPRNGSLIIMTRRDVGRKGRNLRVKKAILK
jgi:hypothetical protein